MTRLRSLTVGLSLCAMVLFASTSHAAPPTILFNGAGSSVQFNTWAFAAEQTSPPICGTRNWTKTNGAVVHDSRSSLIADVQGDLWVVWDNDANPTTICAYIRVNTEVGVRAFFAVPTCTLVLNSSDNGSAGDDLVPAPFNHDVALPAAVFNALYNNGDGTPFNASMTDMRPEDALFATNRVEGLGYNGPILGVCGGPVGPVPFALSGNDPITGLPITFTYTTATTGAGPVVVFVNTTLTGLGHTGSNLMTNIPRFVLGWALNGNLTRVRDLQSVAANLPSIGLHVFLFDPLSGTYNTMEYDIVHSLEVNSSRKTT